MQPLLLPAPLVTPSSANRDTVVWLLPVPTPLTAAARNNNGVGGRDGRGASCGLRWAPRRFGPSTPRAKYWLAAAAAQAPRISHCVVALLRAAIRPAGGAGGRSAAGFTYVDAGSVQRQANIHPPPEHQTQRKTSFLSSPQNKLSSGFQFWNVPKIFFFNGTAQALTVPQETRGVTICTW